MPSYTDKKGVKRYTGIPGNPTKGFISDLDKFPGLFITKKGGVLKRFANHVEKIDSRLEFKVKENVVESEIISGNINEIAKILTKYQGQNIRAKLTIGNNIVQDKPYSIPEGGFGKWFNTEHIYKDWSEGPSPPVPLWTGFDNARLDIIKGKRVSKRIAQIKQKFGDNASKNCLIGPMREFCVKSLDTLKTEKAKNHRVRLIEYLDDVYRNFKDGVDQDFLDELTNNTHFSVEIRDVLGNVIIKSMPETYSRRTFKYINSRVDHVEHLVNTSVEDSEIVSEMEMRDLYSSLHGTDKFFTWKRDSGGQLIYIETADKRWYSVESVDYKETVEEFNKENKTGQFIQEFNPEDWRSHYIRNGIHFSGHVNYNWEENGCAVIGCDHTNCGIVKEMFHIDDYKSYATPTDCDYYQGIPKLTDIRLVPKLKENEVRDFLDSHVGQFEIINWDFSRCNENVQGHLAVLKMFRKFSYKSKVIIMSPMLMFLFDQGVRFKLLSGCWGISCDFDFDESMYKKHPDDKFSYYSKYTGQCASIGLINSFKVNGDYKMAKLLGEGHEDVVHWEDDEIHVRQIKKFCLYKPMIAAFISGYSQIKVLTQLFQIPVEKVACVCVDGIYGWGDCPPLTETFKEKPVDISKLDNTAFWNSYLSYYPMEICQSPTAKYKKHVKIETAFGKGGAGKTHDNATDTGYINFLYSAITHERISKASEEFGVKTETTAKVMGLGCRPALLNSPVGVIFHDEAGMLTDEMANRNEEINPNCKHIYAGDFRDGGLGTYQAPPLSFGGGKVNSMKPRGEIVHHRKNYRYSKEQNKIIDTFRWMMDKDSSVPQLMSFIMKKYNVVSMERACELYNPGDDTIISHLNASCDEWNEMLGGLYDIDKFRVLKRNARKGVFKGTQLIGNEEDFKGMEVESRNCFTVYSIQGDTYKNKLFIDPRGISAEILQTAIGRAKEANQVYLVIDPCEYCGRHYCRDCKEILAEEEAIAADLDGAAADRFF